MSSCTLLATGAALIVAAPAFAQGGGRQVDIKAVGAIEYNDNVVLNDPRISGGGTRGDVIAAPSIDLNIRLPRATGDVYLSGNVGYRFYKNYSRLNREYIALTGGGNQRLASCMVHGEVGYRRALTDLGSLFVQDASNSFENTEEGRQFSVDVGCGGQFGLRPTVAYSRTETRNSLEQRQFADSNSDTFTGQLGLQVPAIGTVSVFGRTTNSSYIRRATPTGGRDGMKSYAAGLQLERTVGTRLNFRGSVNYTKVDPKLPGTRDFSGIGYNVSGQYSGEDYSIQIVGSRNAEPSLVYFVSYNIATVVSVSGTKRLSDRINLTFGATRTWRDFASSNLFPGAPLSGSDKMSSLTAGATYTPIRRLSFSLSASYNERTSNVQLFKYKAKRVVLTTSLSL